MRVFGMARMWGRIALGVAAIAGFASGAHAVCTAANQYNFSFATQTAATLNYANSYTYTGTSLALGNQNFTVDWITNGVSSSVVAGAQMPAISGLVTDGVALQNLVIGAIFTGRTADVAVNNRVVVTRLTFPAPIRDLTVQINDIDFTANQFRDWLHVNGINGASNYNPALVTPHGNNNTGGPLTNANSSMTLGPTTTPGTITIRQALGTGASGNNANTGTVTASFAQPVTQVEIRYGNFPDGGATGQQAIGIQSVSWCPMPVVTMTKTSTPYSDPFNGTTNPKLIPGSDFSYTLTVSNSNSSPVDASTLVLTDILPTQLTYYNGDIDDAGPLTTSYEFIPGTSGLTFAPANLTYSNNNGATYAYTPTAGYDANVDAIRLAPQGTMAANSSFSIRFRTRIN
jgi:uncharacterized repeat protein (TIGR01451 family)